MTAWGDLGRIEGHGLERERKVGRYDDMGAAGVVGVVGAVDAVG